MGHRDRSRDDRERDRSRPYPRSRHVERRRSRSRERPRDTSEDGSYFVQLKGLPWAATERDIFAFFESGGVMGVASVILTSTREGKPDGEAYAELRDRADYQKALAMDHQYLGNRYIVVVPSRREERDYALKRVLPSRGNDTCLVKMRGLPYGSRPEEIANFFRGIDLVPNGGIMILKDKATGRETGEAFVRLASRVDLEGALTRNRQSIGHRYIELFRSSHEELSDRLRKCRVQLGNNFPVGLDGPMPGFGGPMGVGYGGGPSPEQQMFGAITAPIRESAFVGGIGAERRPGPPVAAGGMGPFPVGSAEQRFRSYDHASPGPSGARMERNYRGSPPPQSSGPQSVVFPAGPHAHGQVPVGFQPQPGIMGIPTSAFQSDSPAVNGGPPRGHSSTRDDGGHFVFIKGMPTRVSEKEVREFFIPVVVKNVQLGFDRQSRPTGEANLEFYTQQDAVQAMKKDGYTYGNRRIEMTLNTR